MTLVPLTNADAAEQAQWLRKQAASYRSLYGPASQLAVRFERIALALDELVASREGVAR